MLCDKKVFYAAKRLIDITISNNCSSASCSEEHADGSTIHITACFTHNDESQCALLDFGYRDFEEANVAVTNLIMALATKAEPDPEQVDTVIFYIKPPKTIETSETPEIEIIE